MRHLFPRRHESDSEARPREPRCPYNFKKNKALFDACLAIEPVALFPPNKKREGPVRASVETQLPGRANGRHSEDMHSTRSNGNLNWSRFPISTNQ